MSRIHRPIPHDQVILITGAGSGIGAATAQFAVGQGHRVIIADIDIDSAKRLAGELGARSRAVELDIRDADSWHSAFDAAESEFGPVDVLINNAGIIHTGYARKQSLHQHREIIDVNLIGTMNGVLTALERMNRRGSGHIINVCSMTSFLPLSGYATYGATKHAMRAFHHSVAIEERSGPVSFSIVHPPSTRTPMLEQEKADPTAAIAFAEKSHSAEDVARVVVRAIERRPVEVVFPRLTGRFQRIAGSLPSITRIAIPLAEASGRRKRAKLMGSTISRRASS